MPGALYFDLGQFVDRSVKPYNHKMPSQDEISSILKQLGIGRDSKVICYDNENGACACRLAFLLSVVGLVDVRVLEGKFGTWNPKSDQEITPSVKATGTLFDFVYKTNDFAQFQEVLDISQGKSSA
jgi:3-mercaptopyruvate sulfurtransferase SseA